MNARKCHLISLVGTPLVVQWLRLHAPNVGGPGSLHGQGTRLHMLQQRSKIPRAATKTQHSQINKNNILKKIIINLISGGHADEEADMKMKVQGCLYEMPEVYARSPISPLEFKSRGSKCRYTGQRVREPDLICSFTYSGRESCGQVYPESAHHIRKHSTVGPKDQDFPRTKAGRKREKVEPGWVPLKNSDPAETHTQNPARQ